MLCQQGNNMGGKTSNFRTIQQHILHVLAQPGMQPIWAVFPFCLPIYKHTMFTGAKRLGCFHSLLNMAFNLLRTNTMFYTHYV